MDQSFLQELSQKDRQDEADRIAAHREYLRLLRVKKLSDDEKASMLQIMHRLGKTAQEVKFDLSSIWELEQLEAEIDHANSPEQVELREAARAAVLEHEQHTALVQKELIEEKQRLELASYNAHLPATALRGKIDQWERLKEKYAHLI